MTAAKPSVVFGSLLGLIVSVALVAAALQEGTNAGARFVPIEIRLGEQVLWEGNASDDGHANADAVWDRLKDAPLRPGPDFDANAAKIDQDGDTASLEGNITVDVRYGGRVTVREITLNKVTTDKGDRWIAPAELVEKWFWSRRIDRLHAAHLQDFHEVTDRE